MAKYQIMLGVEGHSLVNISKNMRVCGPKAWGGGELIDHTKFSCVSDGRAEARFNLWLKTRRTGRP